MVSDQTTQIPKKTHKKTILILALTVIFVTAFLVVLYLSLRHEAFTKTHPYVIEVQLESGNSSRMVVYYDYGYGFQLGHHQVFNLIGNQKQTINFTISAWKKLRALRLNSDDITSLKSLMIQKGAAKYQALSVATNISEESVFDLYDIDETLIEMQD